MILASAESWNNTGLPLDVIATSRRSGAGSLLERVEGGSNRARAAVQRRSFVSSSSSIAARYCFSVGSPNGSARVAWVCSAAPRTLVSPSAPASSERRAVSAFSRLVARLKSQREQFLLQPIDRRAPEETEDASLSKDRIRFRRCERAVGRGAVASVESLIGRLYASEDLGDSSRACPRQCVRRSGSCSGFNATTVMSVAAEARTGGLAHPDPTGTSATRRR